MKKRSDILIMIDPGHGGGDPGACAEGIVEAEINLLVGVELARILRERGIMIAMTRWRNKTVSLANRIRLEHDYKPDLFISLHCNGFDDPAAHGIEVWTSPGDTGADSAATAIFMALSRAFHNRRLRTDCTDGDPDKEARFAVLTQTRCPAILVEMGFVGNPGDRAWLLDPMTQSDLAAAIMTGAVNWVDQIDKNATNIAFL